MNNLLDVLPDGRLEFDDTDTTSTLMLGVLTEPRADTRIGLTYISKVDLELRDENKFSGTCPLLNAALSLSGLRNYVLKRAIVS